ncbi:MAG TPA: hypothetical protein VHF91_08735 [Acidimicrobiales bacterium]|nr:hypothetical protein [Acidimicrobiales bacterium]
MTTVVVVLVLLVLSAVLAATVVVRTNKRKFAEANAVVPGTATQAPPEWAGAHSPEARLHRRLRDAVTAVRANPALEDAFMMDARVSLEQQALAVDERLIAVAALPERVRAEPLASVAAAVEAVEAAVAAVVAGPVEGQRGGVDQAMAEVADRVSQLQQGGSV